MRVGAAYPRAGAGSSPADLAEVEHRPLLTVQTGKNKQYNPPEFVSDKRDKYYLCS